MIRAVRRTRIVLCALVLAAALSGPVVAQTADADRDAMWGRYLGIAALVADGTIEPHWLPDGDSFWFARGAPDRTVVTLVDPAAGAREPMFDPEEVRSALAETLGHEPPYEGLPFDTFDFAPAADGPGLDSNRIRFVVENREFEMVRSEVTVRPTGRSEAERSRYEPGIAREAFPSTSPDVMEILSPDRRWFLTDQDGDLWLRSTYDERLERLTEDAEEWFEWSVSGAAWSPGSSRVAALKNDERHVHKVPLVHWLKTHEEIQLWPFTKAGGPLPLPELHVVDVLSKRVVEVDVTTGLEVPDADRYLGILGWTKDGSELLFSRLNRAFNTLDIMSADPETGDSRIILTETQPTFIKGISINPGLPDLFTPLEDGRRFLWISERDGFDHIYLYDLRGTLIRQLTRGGWPVRKIVAVDEESGWIYFTAHADTADVDPELGAARLYDTHLYRVALDGSGLTRLTEDTGEHSIEFSPSKRFFADTHSTPARPPRTELRAADGTLVLTAAESTIETLAELDWSAPEPFVAKADDGVTDLYGILYKPADFDPTARYPVIDFIYGGPYRTQTPNSFTHGNAIIAGAYAQLGYIVMMVDARGTPERGKAFQDVVYGNFGRNEIPDHVAALRDVAATRSYMDLDRVGIFGGSWGGYMTIRALVLAPEVYDVGVSLYPVVDLYDHAAQALEPYMGLLENRPDAYEYGSSTRLADRVEGKLLLIHGTNDVNATFSATMKMVEALVRAGKPYDLIVLPEESHSLSVRARNYWLAAMKNYFLEHLPPGPGPSDATSGGS